MLAAPITELLDGLPNAVFVDISGRVAAANEAARRLVPGLEAGRDVAEVLPATCLEPYRAARAAALDLSGPRHLEIGLPSADECEPRTIPATVAPYRSHPDAVLVTLEPAGGGVAALRSALDALTAERERYRLVDDAPIPFWQEDMSGAKARLDELAASGIDDIAGYLRAHDDEVLRCASLVRIAYTNEAAAEYSDSHAGQWIDRPLERTLNAESLSSFREELIAFWNGRTRFNNESSSRTGRRTQRYLVSASIGTGAERDWSRVFLSIVDVTGRRNAERRDIAQHMVARALAESRTLAEASERLLEAMCQHLDWDVALIIAGQRGGQMDIQERWVDPRAPWDEAASNEPPVPPEALQFARDVAQRGGASWMRLTDAGGQWLPLPSDRLSTAAAFSFAGPAGLVGAVLLLTREVLDTDEAMLATLAAISGQVAHFLQRVQAEEIRTRLEEQLRQSQKMEAIGRLAGGVAHDFNNLLTAIIGYADILAAGMAPDDGHLPDVEEIRKAGERAAALTRQLLAFSRRQVLQPAVIDFNDVVAGIAPMLRRLVGEQIELRTPAAPDLGRVRADPSQIEQVLLNLVVNARDAMPAGGTLTIETADTDLDDEYARTHPPVAPGPYVLLAVSDTGTGMDEATMAHLFEPFFTTKPAGEGTGLGLATVYGIVSQSGGSITAYSEPGHGSVFKVFLPRVGETVEPHTPALAEPAASGAETILLVEDEDVVRSFVERVLGRLGYTVTTARSGDEALALAADHAGPIDLLITDVMLPGINGREISERLTALRPSLRTLFVSGYTEDSIVHRGELDPDIAFLSKPFTPDALGHAVRDVLGTGTPVRGTPAR